MASHSMQADLHSGCHRSARPVLALRATVVARMHKLYETERAKRAKELELPVMVMLTGNYWSSLGNHSYVGVTAHYTDEWWELHAQAWTTMTTEERQRSTLSTDSA